MSTAEQTSSTYVTPKKSSVTPVKYDVELNYFYRRSVQDKGITVDYRCDHLRSFDDKMEALSFARQQRGTLKQDDTIYVLKRNGSSVEAIHYITRKEDGPCNGDPQ